MCHFPDYWILRCFLPVHKLGVKTQVANYKAVCGFSFTPKLFIVVSNMLLLMNSKQHGFVSGRYTFSNLTFFSNYIPNVLELGDAVI